MKSLRLLFVILLGTAAGSCGLSEQVKNIETLAELEGRYALTGQTDIQIRPDEGSWVFQIGDEDAYPVETAGETGWIVPDLDVELHGVKRDKKVMLHVTRYGETASLVQNGDGLNLKSDGISVPEIVEKSTPRLMIAHNVPGVSVAVIENGEITWTGQYGIKTYGQPERVKANTIFEAASMSKPLYAYVVLGLAEEGVLDLDIPLVDYLGEPYSEAEPGHEKITTRMVLSHTGGFPNWRSGGWRSGAPVPVLFEPGTDFRYSGEGFLFLQQVVEKLTGIPTEELIQTRLLEPLEMQNSSYVWQPAYDSLAAAGHDGQGFIPEQERRIYHTANTAFTLYTTPSDYARFLIEIMSKDHSKSYSLGADMLEEMLTVQSDAEGRDVMKRRGSREGTVHFGLGWRIEVLENGKRICHSGSNRTGFRCYSEFNPDTGNGIIIMTNGTGGTRLRTELIRYAGE